MTYPSGLLNISGDIIGRDASKTRMVSLFESVGRGKGKVLLVPGHSGIGKTSLVQWLEKPVNKQNGIFVTGKFDQYHQNIPYYAVRQALQQLWHRTAGDLQKDGLAEKITRSLGNLSGLLGELIPEIKQGEEGPGHPEDNHLSHIEARHRFAAVIGRFLNAVCGPEQPVVIFIDDWQWADSASLELLKRLSSNDQLRFCLVIASYRDEEVDKPHPLNAVTAEMARQDVPPDVIEVGRLTPLDAKALISDALQGPVNRLDELTGRICDLTRGNPFHIKVFLSLLHTEGLLWHDPEAGTWCWRFGTDLPQDIVALFNRRLSRFPKESQELISLAACIGSAFDLQTLGIISSRPALDCLALLTPFKTAGLILEAAPDPAPESSCPPEPAFTFLHDRVQQAAYLLIDPEKLPDIHLRIGRLLTTGLDAKAVDNRLFEILDHLNTGGNAIEEPDELRRMVALNMTASSKARAATAFNEMSAFNRSAYRFADKLPGKMPSFWADNYDAALTLHRSLAESEFLEGNYSRAEQLIQESLTHTPTPIERAESLNILIVQYTLLARYTEAIASGRQALAEFGISLPKEDFEICRDREIQKVQARLLNQPVSRLNTLPVMTNPVMLTITKLLITLGPPCYRTHQRLWSVIVPKVVGITLIHGLVPQIGYSHTAFGGLLCWVKGDYDTARDFGSISEKIMKATFDSPPDQSVFYLMIGSSVRHWFAHLRHASEDFNKAFDIGRQSGNLQYAAYAFGHNMYCRFFQGTPLSRLISDTEQSLIFSKTRLNHWALDLLEGGLAIFKAAASDLASGHNRFSGESDYLEQVRANKNTQVLCIYKILKTVYHVVFEEFGQALALSDEIPDLLYTVGTQGLLPWPEYEAVRFLVLSAQFKDADESNQPKWRMEMGKILEQLETWARQCPENHTHKLYLARAEITRIDNQPGEAATFYDNAIAAAQTNRFVQWEALANERAFHFWAGLGNGHLAQIYWQQAYTAYRIWGAQAKLRTMERQYRNKLGAWYAKALSDGSSQADKGKAVFIRKHIELIRYRSKINFELEKQASASRIADDLAHAVNRLRVESAERRMAEAELNKIMLENRAYIEQLEQKNAELDEFTYIASHDLQEPLRKLTAFSRLLVTDAGDHLNDQAQKDVEYITDAAQRMSVLIQDLLELSRTGQGTIHFKTVTLNRCVDRVLTLLQGQVSAAGAKLIKTDLPQVQGDEILIDQIFQNLIQNALKFNDKERPVIEITCRHRDDGPVIGVRDNGIGLKPQYAKQIFHPFKRLHGRSEFPGTGIGLAICRKAVERHGGTIWVDSVVGAYAHFQFTLNRGKEVP